MNSFSIQSFGCRVNQAEAFHWADRFQRRGLLYQKDHQKSDLILVNTCTITSRADRDVRNFIRRMHRENPAAKLVVTGCFAEKSAEELRKLPGIWKVFSNLEKETLPDRLLNDEVEEAQVALKPFRSRALIKIQDGCDFGCTFCIVPSVRGKSRSYTQPEILKQVRYLVEQGFKEIVLAGVHLCLYGRDLDPPLSFRGLLEEITSVAGVHRLRLSSLDPRFLDEALLEHLVSNPKICPNFHLSFQHGANRIISLMGRKIGTGEYSRILEFLFRESPRAALGTDIIVGFPGETPEDFAEMSDFLEQMPLTYFHVFSYSPRPGTPAASWKQVHPEYKKERAVSLRTMAKKKNLDFRTRFLDEICEAIVIGKKESGEVRVLTDNYIEVALPACLPDEKALVDIRINEVSEQATKGVSLLLEESVR
ncbi:MAG: tRNA (N(6)-L-threonylcarbamoyladenosine(37)-C(2))-methylthiotransferase MtaB [Candidatus Aminicenantes bacterium]|nr:tRNA (N(6)-L-threonylcarbamoyladenosine(37)-C(2))-methylthiotransferase MtaB [Candidatus Aminicenantes bacterium]